MNSAMAGACALAIVSSAIFCPYLSADTAVRKDGTEIKGVLIEEYKDRFILSTAYGEVPVMKADVKDLVIDDEEANLLHLADKARDRRDYAGAAEYYERVLALDPGSDAAKKGLLRMREIAFRRAETVKGAPLARHEEPDKRVPGPVVGKRGEEVEILDRKLYGILGFRLNGEDGCYKVSAVKKESPAIRAGIRKGDTLFSVEGRLVCHGPLVDVVKLLLGQGGRGVGCAIERTLDLKVRRGPMPRSAAGIIGATLYLGSEGITVKDVSAGSAAMDAGMEGGDIVTAIDGKQTRYMALAKANGMIRSSKEGRVRITIRRDVVIWKESIP